MKGGLTAVVSIMVFASAVYAANTPPPVSAQCRITCIVEQRAEWATDKQSVNMPQTSNSNPALVINSAPSSPADSESMVEVGSNGEFHSGNFPVEILVSAAREGGTEKTITACWKI